MANNGHSPAKRPKYVTGSSCPDPPEGPGPRYFANAGPVLAGDLRAELSRTRDECNAGLRDSATLARVRVLLGLPDQADGSDVIDAVTRLKQAPSKKGG